MRYAAATDIGTRRSVNEDSYLADGRMFAVADGMGGHLAGEIASAIAIDCLRDAGAAANSAKALSQRFERANTIIFDRAQADSERQGMGTTLTACVVDRGRLFMAHVGDSRLYRLRAGKLKQLTKDHSLVAQMVERGHLSPEQALGHPQRSVITRALGAAHDIKVDLRVRDILAGDRYLLATDGLTIAASDEEIAAIVAGEDELESVAARLVELANSKGGVDNTTVIVFEPDDLTTKPRPKRLMKYLGITLVLILLLSGAWGALQYLRSGFYLGEHEGRVAIYRGVPGSFAGLTLRTLERETSVKVSDLPAPYRERLSRGIPSGSLEEAEATVRDYSTLSREKR